MRPFLAALLFAVISSAQTAKYPSAIAGNVDLTVAANRVQTTLTQAMGTTDTSFTVASATGIVPNSLLTVDAEIVFACSVVGKTISIGKASCPNIDGRGFDATTANVHIAGATVSMFLDAWHHNSMAAEIKAIETALGVNMSLAPGALPSGTALQYLRKNATNTATEFASFNANSIYSSGDYNFAAQTPGGSLTGTIINSVTLAPCPFGVAGTDVGHYLRVSGGAGTAEAVLISGGTCTSNAASGTVFFTPANNHSGAWTISSATAGIEEALFVAGVNGQVRIPAGTTQLYGKVVVPYKCSIRGAGMQGTAGQSSVLVANLTGRLIESTTAISIDMGDFSISYPVPGTSGEAIYLQDITDGLVSNIYVLSSYDGLTLVSVARLMVDHIILGPQRNGINVSSNTGSSVTTVSYPQFSNMHFVLPVGVGTAVNLGGNLAGMTISNGFFEQGLDCIDAIGAGSALVNEVQITNTICDNYSQIGMNMTLTGSASSARFSIANSIFAGGTYGLLFRTSTAGNILALNVTGSKIGYSTIDGVRLEGVKGAVFTGNTIYTSAVGGGGNAVELNLTANENILFSGNLIGANFLWGNSVTPAAYGVLLGAQAHKDINITGNTIAGSTATIADGHTGTGLVTYRNNMGVDDVIPAVASTAALVFPINPIFNLTGNTTVTSVSGLFKGQRGQFLPSAVCQFTAGATIGITFTTTINVPVVYFFDGTRIWLK